MSSMARLCKCRSAIVELFDLTPYRQLDLDALVAAMRALEALAHERTVAKLKQESGDVGYEGDNNTYALPYDPVSIFLLETMVSVSCQTAQYIEDVWYARCKEMYLTVTN